MGGFYFRLENEDGTPADPPNAAHGRTELAGRRHDPAQRGQDVVDTRSRRAGLASPDNEPDREAPAFDRARSRALADHAADSPGMGATNASH